MGQLHLLRLVPARFVFRVRDTAHPGHDLHWPLPKQQSVGIGQHLDGRLQAMRPLEQQLTDPTILIYYSQVYHSSVYCNYSNDYAAAGEGHQLCILPRVLQTLPRQHSTTHADEAAVQRTQRTHHPLRQTRKKREMISIAERRGTTNARSDSGALRGRSRGTTAARLRRARRAMVRRVR